MKIKRELEYAQWEYDPEKGEVYLSIIDKEDPEHPGIQRITIKKSYVFSLARFFIRVFQNMAMKKRKAKVTLQPAEVLSETTESSSET